MHAVEGAFLLRDSLGGHLARIGHVAEGPIGEKDHLLPASVGNAIQPANVAAALEHMRFVTQGACRAVTSMATAAPVVVTANGALAGDWQQSRNSGVGAVGGVSGIAARGAIGAGIGAAVDGSCHHWKWRWGS